MEKRFAAPKKVSTHGDRGLSSIYGAKNNVGRVSGGGGGLGAIALGGGLLL